MVACAAERKDQRIPTARIYMEGADTFTNCLCEYNGLVLGMDKLNPRMSIGESCKG